MGHLKNVDFFVTRNWDLKKYVFGDRMAKPVDETYLKQNKKVMQ